MSFSGRVGGRGPPSPACASASAGMERRTAALWPSRRVRLRRKARRWIGVAKPTDRFAKRPLRSEMPVDAFPPGTIWSADGRSPSAQNGEATQRRDPEIHVIIATISRKRPHDGEHCSESRADERGTQGAREPPAEPQDGAGAPRRARGGGRADQQGSETEDDRGDGRQVAPPLCGAPSRRPSRRTSSGCAAT